MSNKRVFWIDSLKGILMMLVVLGHTIQYIFVDSFDNNHVWNYIYSFHMPAFMAVSGWLSYRVGGGKNRLSIIIRRFQQLIVPYFAWEMIYRLLNGNLSGESLIKIFTHPYYWFLWVLFFIIVTFQFGDWLSVKYKIKQEIIIILLGLMFTAIMVIGEVRIFGFQFIAYYYVFYILGYYIHKYPKFLLSSNFCLIVMVVIWAIMAWFWNMHELPPFLVSIPLPKAMMQYSYRFITGMIAIYVILCVAPKFMNIVSIWNKPLIELGKISLGIYVVHLLLIPYITHFIVSFTNCFGTAIIISFVFAVAISWMIVWLFGKWNLTSKLLLGKS